MFHAQEIFQVMRIQVFQKDSLVDKAGKRERDGAVSWKESIGTVQRDSPNMIIGLTPYQILEKRTSQTKKDMKFAGRKDR